MSVRAKMILIFLGLSVLPLGALTFLSYTNSLRSLKELVERENHAAAADLQHRVAALNRDVRQGVEAITRLPEFETVDPGTPFEAEQAAELARAMQAQVSSQWSLFSDLEFEPSAPLPSPPAPPAHPAAPRLPVAGPAHPPAPQRAGAVPRPDGTGKSEGSSLPGAQGDEGKKGLWSMRVILPDFSKVAEGNSGATPTIKEFKLDFVNGEPTKETADALQNEVVEGLVRLPGFLLQTGSDGRGIKLRNLIGELQGEAGAESKAPAMESPSDAGGRTGRQRAGERPGGNPSAASPAEPRSRALENLPSALERREFFQHLDREAARRTQAIRLPVRRARGEVGNIVARIRPDRLLSQAFGRTPLSEGEIAFAVDPLGVLHATSEKDMETLRTLGVAEAGSSTPTDPTLAAAAAIAPAPSAEGDRTSRAVSTEPAGLAKAIRDPSWISVIEKDEQTGYTFGIVRPVATQLQMIRRAAVANLLLGFAFIGLAGSGVIVFSHRMTSGLDLLTLGARRIAGGDLCHRIESRRKDELGDLAAAFNEMAADLEVSRQRLVEQERMQRDLEIARQIQRDFLPREDLVHEDVEITGRSIPSKEVGGDFFNFLPLGEGRVAILIGDVSGKGVPAALLMAEVQATIRTLLRYHHDVERVMSDLNVEVARTKAENIYFTAFLGLLDRARGDLTYVNAGQTPPYLLSARDGELRRLDPTARPIGLFEDSPIRADRVPVGPGDLLFLYTDGVLESTASQGEEFFGHERIESILKRLGSRPPREVLKEVEARLTSFHGERGFEDDATLVVARFRGGGRRAGVETTWARAGAAHT